MRNGLFFLAGAALAVAACGNDGAGDATANADSGLTADKIASNDVTAIDAVTGEAANMAADVDFTNLVENEGNQGTAATARPKPAVTAKPAREPAPAPAPEPTEPANAAE